MLNFCDFNQVYVFSTNHHLKLHIIIGAVSCIVPLLVYFNKSRVEVIFS